MSSRSATPVRARIRSYVEAAYDVRALIARPRYRPALFGVHSGTIHVCFVTAERSTPTVCIAEHGPEKGDHVYSLLTVDGDMAADEYEQWLAHALPHLRLKPELLGDSRQAAINAFHGLSVAGSIPGSSTTEGLQTRGPFCLAT